MTVKERVRQALRNRGVEIGGYRYTVPARRQEMLRHYGVRTLVDVGANVGQYAIAAREAGYAYNIISFEPSGDAFPALEAASSGDPRWRAEKLALGSEDGTLTLNLSEGSIFNSALVVTDAAVTASPNARIIGTESVAQRTLDSVFTEIPTERPLAIKIDVQGFERAVLDGATSSIAEARIVEMELTPVAVYDGQMLLDEAMSRMSQAGFVLSLTENLFPEKDTGRALQFNGIFVRP